MCTSEQEKILVERFGKAYEKRFEDGDIDWKKTFNKDRRTGETKEGTPLAYLNWAVAWRTFKQIYPDGNFRVINTPEGSPLWNVNGYGMVKVCMSSTGIEYTETFPIMQGGQNSSMKVEEIDGRDVNDAIQRALTKLVARFGVGLYIYEGKLEYKPQNSPRKAYEPQQQARTQTEQSQAPNEQKQPMKTQLLKTDPASEKQIKFCTYIMEQKGYTADSFVKAFGKLPSEMNAGECKEAIDTIKSWPMNLPKEDVEDDLPF